MTLIDLRPAIPCLLLTVLVPLGCKSEPEPESPDDEVTQTCLQTYAADNGYGHESDNDDDCAQPPPGSEPIECAPAIERAAQECADDGQSCDPDAFITREAARCLAEAEGLEPGIAEWSISLVYHYDFKQVLWIVDNTLTMESCGDLADYGGESLLFSAETGELLGSGLWDAIAC